MKIIISESQHDRLFDNQKILELPSIDHFGGWDVLQSFLERKGNPLYSISGNLDLREIPIESLGNLYSVGGNLDLYRASIESLGNLSSVGGDLNLYYTPIKSLGNLTSVGDDLYLQRTPISKKYSEDQIREMVSVDGDIYF